MRAPEVVVGPPTLGSTFTRLTPKRRWRRPVIWLERASESSALAPTAWSCSLRAVVVPVSPRTWPRERSLKAQIEIEGKSKVVGLQAHRRGRGDVHAEPNVGRKRRRDAFRCGCESARPFGHERENVKVFTREHLADSDLAGQSPAFGGCRQAQVACEERREI